MVNTLGPRQNGPHFPDDIFKCIFSNENVWTSIKISPKFVPEGPINIIPASFQIMAWCQPGRVTHICVSKLTIIGSDSGWTASSHYLNQCWNIINFILRNKLQWNLNRNSYIFTQENAFENSVWKMAAILSWPQCVEPISLVFCIPVSGKMLQRGRNPVILHAVWDDSV